MQVTTEKQRDAFLAALAGDEDWLYCDEGEAAQAPAFRCGASPSYPAKPYRQPTSCRSGRTPRGQWVGQGKHSRGMRMQPVQHTAPALLSPPDSMQTKIWFDIFSCGLCVAMLAWPRRHCLLACKCTKAAKVRLLW